MKKLKKIAFYCSYGGSLTGGPQVVLNFIDNIDRGKFEPILITQMDSELVTEVKRRSVKAIVCPLPELLNVYEKKTLSYPFFKKIRSFRSLIEYNKEIKKLLHNNEVDILWARNVKSVMLTGLACQKIQIPLIWDIGLEPPAKGWFLLFHFMGLNIATQVVTEAESQQEDIFGKFLSNSYSKKIQTISPGISETKIKAITQNINKEERNSDQFIVLNVATINYRKNQMMLLKVCKKLARTYSDIQFKLVGPVVDEEYFKKLKTYVDTYDLRKHVEFMGWRDDVPEIMGGANVLAMSSYNEGIPYVIHEAMHSELPIIVTKAGGMEDAVKDNLNGFTVEINDVEGMSNYIERLRQESELSVEMGEKSKELAMKKYTIDNWSQNYHELINNLLSYA